MTSGLKRLLNISTHACDLEVIGNDWNNARSFCARNGFDGFELSLAHVDDAQGIPADIITAVHLKFFPLLDAMWRGDARRLREIFGDETTVESFYGGPGRRAIIDTYRRELAVAERLGCEYVVFHVAQTEVESVYTWDCPWTWQETVGMCAEIINEATRGCGYTGQILFENLWFPGSMRFDSPEEIALLFEKVDYPRCGLVLDTGHVLNKNPRLRTEAEGIEYLIQTLSDLGEYRHLVKALHLTRSLSGDYAERLHRGPSPFEGVEEFWERFGIAQSHVLQIDQHEPFDDPGISRLFDWISPDYLVFEFFYGDMAEWQTKIARQKRALDGVDPSRCPLCGRPNECAALRGEPDCWCKTVVVPQDVMDRVPPKARGVACVCRECAAER